MTKLKLLASLCATVVVFSGCYTPSQYPLQPKEKIIFSTAERAAAFRTKSGNDTGNAGKVVEITRPTSVIVE